MAIGILAKLKIQKDKIDEFEAAFTELMAVVKEHEPGNVYYTLNRSREEVGTYYVMEQYVDQAAVDAHGKSDAFKAVNARLGPLVAAQPEIELLDSV